MAGDFAILAGRLLYLLFVPPDLTIWPIAESHRLGAGAAYLIGTVIVDSGPMMRRSKDRIEQLAADLQEVDRIRQDYMRRTQYSRYTAAGAGSSDLPRTLSG